MKSYTIFNYAIDECGVKPVIYGDLCIQEFRHKEYINEKIGGVKHSVIKTKDAEYNEKTKTRVGVGLDQTWVFLPQRAFTEIAGVPLIDADDEFYIKVSIGYDEETGKSLPKSTVKLIFANIDKKLQKCFDNRKKT